MIELPLCQCGCGKQVDGHYTRAKKGRNKKGEPRRYIAGHSSRVAPRGAAHGMWCGGRSQMVNGYIRRRLYGRYEYEHRLVMQETLGRPLAPDEHVHHLNRVKTDNRPENLTLVSHGDHARFHGRERERTRKGQERELVLLRAACAGEEAYYLP